MSELLASVDFLTSAAATAAKARGLEPVLPTDDPLDVNTALKCMSAFQFYVTVDELAQLDDEKKAAPLVAAARILLSTAQQLRRAGEKTALELDHLAFHASLAYAMHGNFPSAKAALAAVSAEFIDSAPTFQMVAAICDPCGPRTRSSSGSNSDFESFQKSWYVALRARDPSNRQSRLAHAVRILVKVALVGTTLEMSLALMARMAAHQGARLATANLYRDETGIPSWFVENSIKSGLATLLPPQRILLDDERIAGHDRNVLLTLPTSTGKTFVAEACMASGLTRRGLCVYVAPYVAIGNQVVASLARRMKDAARVVPMFGGFKFEPLDFGLGPQIVVATPERFDAWLRAGEHLDRLRTVVFDEIHILENGHRGARVEGMVSRLRLQQVSNPALRLVCLSAVLSEPAKVGKWLGTGQEDMHQIGWRPTARRLAMCRSNGRMRWIHGRDSLLPPDAEPWDPVSESVSIPLPGRITRTPFSAADDLNGAQNVATIAIDLLKRLSAPGLVVCQRKADTRLLARSLSTLAPYPTDAHVRAVALRIRNRYSWLGALSDYLEVGVAYHNAALPHDVRRDIEDLTRDGKLRVVCATTTLAEGADLPFRWTLVAHWQAWDGAPMHSMTFRNIAGRCGRAGAFAEGDTVLFENLVGVDRGDAATDIERLKHVMFSSSALQSTVGDGWIELATEKRNALKAAFGSQLMACIGEHPQMQNVVSSFTAASYASWSAGGATLSRILETTLADLLDADKPGGAFAVANSPVRLTALGLAANRSGFSPSTCRLMTEYLSANTFAEGPALYADLLRRFYGVPEQSEDKLRTIFTVSGHKNVVKDKNLEQMLVDLLTPVDIRKVFEGLRPKKSTAGPDRIEAQFEAFVQLVDGVVGHFLPWLLRGLQTIAPYGSTRAVEVRWSAMAQQIENKLAGSVDVDEVDAEPF